MTRSRRPTEPQQLTIDDFDLGVEHILGAVPPDPPEVLRAVRDDVARAFYHLTHVGPPQCVPDQRIHVYAASGPCQCKEIK